MATSTDHLGYASPGGVRQHGGSLPVRICNRCGDQIVWCESKRTGKSYPVNVRRGQLDQRYYIGSDFHPRDCAERRQARINETTAADNRNDALRQVNARWFPIMNTVAVIASHLPTYNDVMTAISDAWDADVDAVIS